MPTGPCGWWGDTHGAWAGAHSLPAQVPTYNFIRFKGSGAGRVRRVIPHLAPHFFAVWLGCKGARFMWRRVLPTASGRLAPLPPQCTALGP